jgi:hypothetical protein
MTTQAVRAAVNAAVVSAVDCLPTVICSLITEYAAPMVWTADGLESAANPPTVRRLPANAAYDFELKFVDPIRRYYTFVSDASVVDGPREWSVEWREEGKIGYVGVGVTTSIQNRKSKFRSGFAEIADTNDWILTEESRTAIGFGMQLRRSGQLMTRIAKDRSVNKIWFSADPTTGIVSARWSYPNWQAMTGYADTDTAKTVPPFTSIRPCVVVCGCATVWIKYAPTDWPSVSRSMTIVDCAIAAK